MTDHNKSLLAFVEIAMNQTDKLVSVLMPAYNAQSTIATAIQSVLSQTHTDLELIIVNDASTDYTVQEIQKFDDPRILVLTLASNGGPGPARNAAIDRATGAWITLIDADDLWAPQRLEKLLGAAGSTEDGRMIADEIVEVFDTPGGLQEWQKTWEGQIPKLAPTTEISLARYLSLTRTVMQPLIPRRILANSKLRYSSISAAEDFEFYIRLFKQGDLRLIFIPFPGYYYRMTPGSLSANPDRSYAVKGMLEALLDELDFNTQELTSIENRIKHLDNHIRYIPFLEAIRTRQTSKAISLAMKNPWYLLEFARRLPGTLPYRLSVMLKRGVSR